MSLKGKYIFIVEDNSMNRVVYQMTLGVNGAFIEFDRRGREAVQKLKKLRSCDLIILDLMLQGGISGFDIFQEIRKMPQYDQIPIVAVSASEPAVAIPLARDLGFSGFISKPIEEEQFAMQIARAIDGEQIWHDGTMARH